MKNLRYGTIMKPEKIVQTEIMKYIKANGGYVIKVIKGNENGIHDLIACIDGYFISIEVKAEKYEADPLAQASAWQKKHLQMVKDAKGISMVVATLNQFKARMGDWAL